jgi:glucose-6-phosphate isomerase
LGHWYRQLLSESIGKNRTKEQDPFTHQLLSVVSSSTDLHSMAQLFLSGYKNLYTDFVFCQDADRTPLSKDHWLLEQSAFLRGRNAGAVAGAIRQGVLNAYDDVELPYRVTELKSSSAYEIGKIMAARMAETMILGRLMDIDPFDQPQVELYKKHTRALLA